MYVRTLGNSHTLLTSNSGFTTWLRTEKTPIVTFGDELSSVPFYVGRNNIQNFRTARFLEVIELISSNPRTIVVVSTSTTLPQLEVELAGKITVREIGRRGDAKILIAERNDSPIRVAHGEVPNFDLHEN